MKSPEDAILASTLLSLNRNFACSLGVCSEQQLQVPVTVTPAPVCVREFSHFIDGIRLPSSLHVVSAAPTNAPMLIVLEPDLLLRYATLYDGRTEWKGKPKIEGRRFTAEESAAANAFLDCALPELAIAWTPLGPFRFRPERSEQDPADVRVFSRQELVIHCPFEVALGEDSGMLHVVLDRRTLSSALLLPDDETEHQNIKESTGNQFHTTHETQSALGSDFDNDKAPEES